LVRALRIVPSRAWLGRPAMNLKGGASLLDGATRPAPGTRVARPALSPATRGILVMDERDNIAAEGGPRPTATEARAGTTGHNVRYVLLFGLGGAVVLLGLVLLTYLST